MSWQPPVVAAAFPAPNSASFCCGKHPLLFHFHAVLRSSTHSQGPLALLTDFTLKSSWRTVGSVDGDRDVRMGWESDGQATRDCPQETVPLRGFWLDTTLRSCRLLTTSRSLYHLLEGHLTCTILCLGELLEQALGSLLWSLAALSFCPQLSLSTFPQRFLCAAYPDLTVFTCFPL